MNKILIPSAEARLAVLKKLFWSYSTWNREYIRLSSSDFENIDNITLQSALLYLWEFGYVATKEERYSWIPSYHITKDWINYFNNLIWLNDNQNLENNKNSSSVTKTLTMWIVIIFTAIWIWITNFDNKDFWANIINLDEQINNAKVSQVKSLPVKESPEEETTIPDDLSTFLKWHFVNSSDIKCLEDADFYSCSIYTSEQIIKAKVSKDANWNYKFKKIEY